ncbi:30S ribosomal protein S20 [Vitiosangium sp. GDMCC 1.1324]|uniref:30S ribosomal protein S20 n=1 Tax=Vitiosangium sp. (strain GDMCC 1.1324) TaxID=2138576 RepID=UPI000D352B40|nr:30S ribosomal protein S20 [Vitiosangium sp. GDMCC 1.1324]PTL82378.1 30S ribosomal protein S20 [Vitiosangium sp. GDMCC 1.1324]
MANTKSAEKRNRQAQKRRARNVNVRTTVKDAVKSLRETLTTTKDAAKTGEALKAATRTISKAASKGVIHKRAASRRISRLAKATNRAKAAAK